MGQLFLQIQIKKIPVIILIILYWYFWLFSFFFLTTSLLQWLTRCEESLDPVCYLRVLGKKIVEVVFFDTGIKLADSVVRQRFWKAVRSSPALDQVLVSHGKGNVLMLPWAKIHMFIANVELGSFCYVHKCLRKIADGPNHHTFSLCSDLLACED